MTTDGQIETLTSVVASQAETIKSQAATIDVLSGGRQKTIALGQTIMEMWTRYFSTLPDVPWKKSVASTMKPFLSTCGATTVGDFGPLQWEAYRDDPAIRKRYRSSTRNVHLARVRTMFFWAVATGQLAENPLHRTKPERGPAKRRSEVSEQDEQTIARDLEPLMRAMYVVSVDSMMRRDETRELQWDEIDWEAKTIFLAAARTKSKKARTVYLTTRAVQELKALPRYANCPYVFANPGTLKPYSDTYMWRHFRRAADENGVKPATGDVSLRWHDATRRTGACRLMRLGAPMPAVQEILGHSSLAVTAGYLHAQRRDVLEAHALLDKAMRKGPHRAPTQSLRAKVASGG